MEDITVLWTLFAGTFLLVPSNISSPPSNIDKYYFSQIENEGGSIIGSEVQYSHFAEKDNSPWKLGYSASVTDEGGIWIGGGILKRINIYEKINLNLSLMPGLYFKGNEIDLGGPIEFRSALEIEYKVNNKYGVGIGIDHRSNAEIYDYNPGMDAYKLVLYVYLD